MWNSEEKLQHTLQITVSEEYRYFIKITVFNSENRIVRDQTRIPHSTAIDLEQGIYILRVEMNGYFVDEAIFLDKDKCFQIGTEYGYIRPDAKLIEVPKQFSSALLSRNYGSSHEYYTEPAIEWSKKETFKFTPHEALSVKSGSRANSYASSLFIFLRFPSNEKFYEIRNSLHKPFYSDFELVDEYGGLLAEFENGKGIQVNEDQGWAAFNAKLEDGIYYLMYKGKEPRQIPLYVYKDWHTQFFMTMGQEPLFGTIRMFLSGNRAFNPDDPTHKYTDILLDKLQNNDLSLDSELVNMVAHGKYRSPMLGLICCYIYLHSQETLNDQLFAAIHSNMQNVILKDNEESADLRALEILAAGHFSNRTYKKTSVKGTPMLRFGFETILKAAVKNKRLITQRSINDYITENLYYDSPFNTFKPIPFQKRKKAVEAPRNDESAVLKNREANEWIKNLHESLPKELGEAVPIDKDILGQISFEQIPSVANSAPRLDKFNTGLERLFDKKVFGYIESLNSEKNDNSWIKNSISDLIKADSNITMKKISTDLNISGSTVSRVFNEWEKESKR